MQCACASVAAENFEASRPVAAIDIGICVRIPARIITTTIVAFTFLFTACTNQTNNAHQNM
jgi:hypothetical protein